MSDFIEVKTLEGELVSINIRYIVSIQGRVVETAVPDSKYGETRYIHTVHNYVQLKKKIQEAQNV